LTGAPCFDDLKEKTMALSFDADSRSAKLQRSFQNLSAAANTLNTATDAFGDAARTLDEAFNKLNPGVTAWVTVSSTSDDPPWEIFEERLGYAKIGGRWGLCLCTVEIDARPDPFGSEETKDSWLFNDAPRSLRIRAIEHVPALVDALAKEVTQTAKRVSEGAEFAQQLAGSISAMAPMAPGRGNR
jgi:hypothetical protein